MAYSKMSDDELLLEIKRRFDEKNHSIKEMEFMTKKLLELNEKTKQAESIKSEFLSLIKNEFNNPISSLLNISHMLVSNKYSDRFLDISKMLDMELLKLDFQLKNIFSATEIEAGEIGNDYSLIRLEDIFNDVLDAFKYIIELKNLTIECDNRYNQKIVTDSIKLYMILLNLVSNACEYSYHDSKILVKLEEVNNKLLLSVEDFGEGIVVHFKKEVFNRFTKFNSGKTRSQSGLGLGLSVCAGYAEALDGKIDFDSEDGHTIFTFTFPILESSICQSSGVGANEFLFEDFDDNDSVEL